MSSMGLRSLPYGRPPPFPAGNVELLGLDSFGMTLRDAKYEARRQNLRGQTCPIRHRSLDAWARFSDPFFNCAHNKQHTYCLRAGSGPRRLPAPIHSSESKLPAKRPTPRILCHCSRGLCSRGLCSRGHCSRGHCSRGHCYRGHRSPPSLLLPPLLLRPLLPGPLLPGQLILRQLLPRSLLP